MFYIICKDSKLLDFIIIGTSNMYISRYWFMRSFFALNVYLLAFSAELDHPGAFLHV